MLFVQSEVLPETPAIKGWDFNQGCSLDGILASMLTTGFQATALGQAIHEVNRMVRDYTTHECMCTQACMQHACCPFPSLLRPAAHTLQSYTLLALRLESG